MDEFIMPLLPAIPLIVGWLLDIFLGDPACLPHPVVGFGKVIAFMERRLNEGGHRKLKGGITAVSLILAVFVLTWTLLSLLYPVYWLRMSVETVLIFFALSGYTLRKEVRDVFRAADLSLEAGRKQVARIVGRDTASLSDREVRVAALETLSENLSDGVVAPLFWYALLGLPGMLAYKMVNTLDSMIGYKNKRYRDFGCVAAHIDDFANYIPARITALLMAAVAFSRRAFQFIFRYGHCHASPNSGYPEAALAGILNCRFGGPHDYFGECVVKPYIGENEREVTTSDMCKALRVNLFVEIICVAATAALCCLFHFQ